jgi:hypothetical protein
MKQKIMIALSVIAMHSVAAHAASYQNLLCANAKGFQPKNGIIYGSENPGAEATTELQRIISEVPNAGEAAFSETLGGYVAVSTKKISKLTISTLRIPGAFSEGCLGMGTGAPLSTGDCLQATACVTTAVTFENCTDVKFDPNTGEKIVTCPNGQVIKH